MLQMTATNIKRTVLKYPLLCLPMKTAMKKRVMGIFSIGEVMFKNQFGLMGKNLRNSRKKNKLPLFSSTWAKSYN